MFVMRFVGPFGLWRRKLPVDVSNLLVYLSQLGMKLAGLFVLVVPQSFNLAIQVSYHLLEFAAVPDKLVPTGFQRRILFRPTFFNTPFDFNPFQPLLAFFDDAGSFYFISFPKLACGVHKVLIARNEYENVVIPFKGLENDGQIPAFADLALGELYKDSADLYISVAVFGLQ
jgi:hypothetical protein